MCEAIDLCGQSGGRDGTLKGSDDVNHLKMGLGEKGEGDLEKEKRSNS